MKNRLVLLLLSALAAVGAQQVSSRTSFLGSIGPAPLSPSPAASWAQQERVAHASPAAKTDRVVAKWSASNRLDLKIEVAIATIWFCMLFSLPLILRALDGRPVTRTQLATAATFWVALLGGLYLFTNVILFNSPHFEEARSLSIIECIYLMAQIITTVGYGDITPAKPRGQVFVGLYVLMTLFVIAMLVSDLVANAMDAEGPNDDTFVARVSRNEEDGVDEGEAGSSDSIQVTEKSIRMRHARAAAELIQRAEKPSMSGLCNSLCVFCFFTVTWIIFFHFYPGEEKTWLQSIYMAVITLSTVGFGAFTPDTEGGKVFAAFWMIFGSAALVSVVTSFTELTMKLNDYERFDPTTTARALDDYKEAHGTDEMNEFEFFKFGLVQKGLASDNELSMIQRAFEHLATASGGPLPLVSLAHLERELCALREAT